MSFKFKSLKAAISNINDGMALGLSGFSYQNPPMECIKEIIRQGKKDLTIISGPTSGIETDMLIGAGCVKKVVTACVAFEKICSVGPNFRKFAEDGKISVWECDESIWHVAIQAGIDKKEYVLWEGAIGTSIPELNKDIKEIKVNGKYCLKIPAIRPDVSIIHTGFSTKEGIMHFPPNLFRGRMFCEKKLMEASPFTIGQVEEINDDIPEIKDLIVGKPDIIVIEKFGCHPGGSNGLYVPDLSHYKAYVDYCNQGKFNEYLEKFIFNIDNKENLNKLYDNSLESLNIL